MISFYFNLRNPFSDRFDSGWCKTGKIGKNKAWEIQVMKTNTIIEASGRLTFRQDHSGINLELGLLGYNICAQMYDIRHWDYENKCWVVYN